MAMDMPPTTVVEYRIERPSPHREGILAKAMAMAAGPRRELADHVDQSSRMATSGLPRIDKSSPALTRADREGLVVGMEASREGRLGTTGVRMPDGYVAERLRIAMQGDRIREAMANDREVGMAEARAHRCQVVRTVMDRRAGLYVEGGEQAARRARDTLPASAKEECRGIMGQAAALNTGRPAQRIDPQVGAHAAASRSGVAPRADMAVSLDLKAPDRTRLDPLPSKRTSIEPASHRREPVRIDPVGAHRARLDLKGPSKGVGVDVMQAFAASGKGRGV